MPDLPDERPEAAEAPEDRRWALALFVAAVVLVAALVAWIVTRDDQSESGSTSRDPAVVVQTSIRPMRPAW